MQRPRILRNGLKRLAAADTAAAAAPSCRRSYITDADVASARRYCMTRLQKNDYDAHLIRRFVPPAVQDTYTALRALNLELVHLPEMVSNPLIGNMRMNFWKESIEHTFAGQPPREPICILLHRGLQDLEARAGSATRKSIRFWLSRLVRTREKHMDNRPFASVAALEDYAENTYSTIMYATLASMPLRSLHVDHLASHIGKACGIVAVLRGIPVLAAPTLASASSSSSSSAAAAAEKGNVKPPGSPAVREPCLLLPLDVMAEEGVKEEEVFRQGPRAPGLQDAVFKVATRANDHLITAREMLKRLKAGEDPGHEFEHQGEGEHFYDSEEADVSRDVRRGFGVLLEAVPAAQWLKGLEQANFDPFAVRSSGWKLPWGIWQALSKERI
ncbi:NADH dehydrogenase (ubiquinone) complex I [Escovopsis weberi]|uniref:NADH dehydrogenase (Ubiquinone) complex I n=1 Tax=Escovopsis weberi TaxID=150374 RepID=A0A0M9VVG4_ESCWE|nr:NADH dehydrogenase (ubiquinone) complex I [Escovopsis weberi]